MAFLEIKNVRVAGISAAVPNNIINNLEVPFQISEDYDNASFVEITGVKQRRVDNTLTTSDLCFRAAEELIDKLGWDKKEISAVITVSQTLDYFAPSTSCILQDKLGLGKDCFCEDIQLGCSGWVFGMMTLASLMQTGFIKRGLLLCGDARGHYLPKSEIESDPLFGYAGTATALEFQEGFSGLKCHFGSDGGGYDSIIIPDGGSRNPITESSLKEIDVDGKQLSPLESRMKGMDVFSFGISTAPKSIKKLADHFNYNYLDSDFFILHQANKKMNEVIVKKLKLEEKKVPSCLLDFGNTNSASIPLTIITQLREVLKDGTHNLTCCGFGVGLSWGTVNLDIVSPIIPHLIEVNPNDNII